MAQHTELLDDVMGLVSVHPGPVMVAMIRPADDELVFLHVSETSPALEIVAVMAPRTRIGDFFTQVGQTGSKTFRVKYWRHSAVAHAVPAFQPSALEACRLADG